MLVDLDEMVSNCPDPRSREYIREAVQCYKTGAYRSSVVACWIAMIFDLVDKIREIGAQGDLAAQETIAKFDRAREVHDVRTSLDFEKELLTLARDKFEFISHIEYIDLSRLAEDRNRCAHPSQVSDSEVFQASPELARLHIINVAKYVLSKPAAQGKAALKRLLEDLDSRFFPAKQADVNVFLSAGPLAKPREALLKNYLTVLIKDLIKGPLVKYERKQRAINALFVLRDMHPEPWHRLIPSILKTIISSLKNDLQLTEAVLFIASEQGYELWQYIENAERLRLSSFVENFPVDALDELEQLFSDPMCPLQEAATSRILNASEAELLNNTFWLDPPTVLIDRLLAIYGSKTNFADANKFAKSIRFYLLCSVDPDRHLNALINAADNIQVRDSIQFPILMNDFIKKFDIGRKDVDAAFEAAGLPKLEW